MDIEKANKLVTSQIEAVKKTRTVRDVIKTDTLLKQDAYDTTAELLKPTTDYWKRSKRVSMKSKIN